MTRIETERLWIRPVTLSDAAFVLELLQEPPFHRFIGDRGVRSLKDARTYIRTRLLAPRDEQGFGMDVVERKEDGAVLGVCGLVDRDSLDDVDLGYALLERYWSRGYAREAAAAVLQYAHDTLGLERVLAITAPDNAASIHLLETLGFEFERLVPPSGDMPENALYAHR